MHQDYQKYHLRKSKLKNVITPLKMIVFWWFFFWIHIIFDGKSDEREKNMICHVLAKMTSKFKMAALIHSIDWRGLLPIVWLTRTSIFWKFEWKWTIIKFIRHKKLLIGKWIQNGGKIDDWNNHTYFFSIISYTSYLHEDSEIYIIHLLFMRKYAFLNPISHGGG